MGNALSPTTARSTKVTQGPEAFYEEWQSIKHSGSGERGIFNREACQRIASEIARREADVDYGCNPCSEIILRSQQFCNLTEGVVRESDDVISLERKVWAASLLGTMQSTFTDFRYLRPQWKQNCDAERLLGVSLTGICDNKIMSHPSQELGAILSNLKLVALNTNRFWAKKMGINQSAAITCVKPSGTVSQLASCASGLHPRHSEYYLRRVRQDIKDPVTQLLIDEGVAHERDQMNAQSMVFEFPMKSPEGCVTRGTRCRP